MRNHYIPQFVLREFSDNDGMIQVYDKNAREIRRSSPKDLFVISGLYHDSVEDVFGRLETRLSLCLRSILDSCRTNTNFTMPDNHVLQCCRQFVLLQLVRTPWAKETGVRALDDIDTKELLGRLANAGFDNLDEAVVHEMVDQSRKDANKKRRSRLWSIVLLDFLADPARAMPDVIPAVQGKGVYLAKTESAFVLGNRGAVSTATKDKPLFHEDREIYFPVSPDIAISLAGNRDQILRCTVDTAPTRKANLSTMEYSDWIVSHSSRLLRSLANSR